jgi:hypothetical protein
MTEPPLDPIPRELCDAFPRAIGAYSNWSRGRPEREVSMDGKPVSISFVCELVSRYDATMPEDLWRLLESATRTVDEPPADRRYSAAAKFLGRLIQERKARPSE